MKASIFTLLVLLFTIFCQTIGLTTVQCENNVDVIEELEDELNNELESDENYEIDKLDETIETSDLEETEEVEIIKFNINGLMLREGVISEEVLRLKKFYILKGYEGLEENYVYDKKTKEITMDYQRKNELVADGIVGVKTFTKINEDMEANKIVIHKLDLMFNIDINQDSPNIPDGDLIIINKDSNTLYHVKNREVLKSYPIATGKDLQYTPEGKFTIVTKFINPTWGGAGRYKPIIGGAPNNPLGKRWMGLSIGGGRVYGIHGNSDKNSIGKYISLGCIRMFNEDVEELYDLIAIGTPVWIGTEEKLKEFGIIFGYKTVTNVDSNI